MFSNELGGVTDTLRGFIEAFDATVLDGAGAVAALEQLDQIARLAQAGIAACAAQIDSTEAWRRSGYRDTAGFVAARTGQHRRQSKDALLVGQQIQSATGLDAAVRTGRISMDKAAEIAAAVAEQPDSEAELLGAAQTATLKELRDACAQVLSRGKGAEERHQRAHKQRYCSSGVGRDGIWRLSAGMAPMDGAVFTKALEHFQNQIFKAARANGDREPFSAYQADALLAMAKAAMDGHCAGGCGTNKQRRRPTTLRHTIVITVPHTTFLHGADAPGNPDGSDETTAYVPGVGPVPVATIHALLADDPIIKCVITRGREITATATMTRTIKEDLRLAVLHRHHYRCAVPGCDHQKFVELDHEIEYRKDGPTSFENLRPLCWFHHDQRTNENYELTGPVGSHQWIAPNGTILTADPPNKPPSETPPPTEREQSTRPNVTV